MSHTICAISTPPGVGGIAVARISGTDTIKIVSKIWKGRDLETIPSHTAHLGTITDTQGTPLDQALLTIFKEPNSFTGETVIELSVHGSTYIQQELINTLIKAGARLAEPGEFTRRAFINSKLDLAQVDGIASLIQSTSKAAHDIAISQMRGGVSKKLKSLRKQLLDLATLLELELDFSEEDVEFANRTQLVQTTKEILKEIDTLKATFQAGKAIKEGVTVAIAGPTNAGKSSLLNTLLGDNKAIVSEIHGTTRDIIEDTTQIGGILFRFLDTAGLRHTTDQIEQLGITRTQAAIKTASTILIVSDSTTSLQLDQIENIITTATEESRKPQIIHIYNKTDKAAHPDNRILIKKLAYKHPDIPTIGLSTITRNGIDTLEETLVRHYLPEPDNREIIMITNARHYQSLIQASESTTRIINGLNANLPTDFIAQDLRETINYLGEITGELTSSEILQNIFQNFCIGK